MTGPNWTTTRAFALEILRLRIRFTSEERASLLAQAEASIKESERAMLLRAKVQTDLVR
jgi:hypothetical protein